MNSMWPTADEVVEWGREAGLLMEPVRLRTVRRGCHRTWVRGKCFACGRLLGEKVEDGRVPMWKRLLVCPSGCTPEDRRRER